MNFRVFSGIYVAFVISVVAGCGGPAGPPVYKTTGTVTYKGQPVEGAVVAFHSSEAGRLATGKTDAQGRFELTTYQPGDGAPAGSHQVTVTKIVTTGGGGGEMSMEQALEQTSTAASKNELPEKYASPGMSQLQFDVASGGENDFTIELTD